MNKIINIEPISVPDKGVGVFLDINLQNYQLFNENVDITISIKNDKNKTILKDHLKIPNEIINNWGTDDTYIVNYVAEFMSVNVIEIIEKPNQKTDKQRKNDVLSILEEKRKEIKRKIQNPLFN
jgi:hypothetical protein